MKIINFLTAVFLVFGAISNPSPKEYNWFYKSNNDNRQPQILGGDCIADNYGALYMGDPQDKTIYLTFDAGYGNENLEKILDVLKKQKVSAAFFILPGIIKNSPETVKRMAAEGHLVCNHSTSHNNMAKITDIAEFEKELTQVAAQYKQLTGLEMERFFRPPQGAFSENTLKFCRELGYTPVFWSLAYADWDNQNQISANKATEIILTRVHNGAVILLHPTSKTNADIIENVILNLKGKGFDFGTLLELKEKQHPI